MESINSPLFCLTSDTDWASDFAIRDFLTLVSGFGIRATVFATHKSAVLEEFLRDGAIELGVHPNFLPASSHGNDAISVIEHICGLFPDARSFRSHHFVDSSDIAREMARRGFQYDSNLCLYLQPDLHPLRHWSGLTRFPVFWEDDVHWANNAGDWDLDRFYHHFLSPGLKILNFHPFMVAANIPNQQYYLEIKQNIQVLSADNIERIRLRGEGARTFLVKLLQTLSSQRFYTLGELHEMLPIGRFVVPEDETKGRHTEGTEEQYARYWNMSDEEKQLFLKEDFEQRAAKDPYATSRDACLRELEIYSIEQNLGERGKILDLGCGNGYTLMSLARSLRRQEADSI